MDNREGTPDSDLVHMPHSRHIAARSKREAFRKEASRMDRRQALRRASPSGPLNATDQPQGLLRVSIRHYGVTQQFGVGNSVLYLAEPRRKCIMVSSPLGLLIKRSRRFVIGKVRFSIARCSLENSSPSFRRLRLR